MITIIFSVIITIAFLLVFIWLIVNCSELNKKEKDIQDMLDRINKNYILDKDTHELRGIADEGAAITPDTVRHQEKEFNKLRSTHDTLSRSIPIFPMLGILGTVIGLMQQVQAKDIDMMLSSLSTALVTTLFGLSAAVVLKFTDLFPVKHISDTEIRLDDYDRKLELAEMYEKKQNAQTGRNK